MIFIVSHLMLDYNKSNNFKIHSGQSNSKVTVIPDFPSNELLKHYCDRNYASDDGVECDTTVENLMFKQQEDGW